MKIFINGRMVDEEKAKISVLDRGLLYGDGLFETMRSYGGNIFALDRHLDRLYASAESLDIKIKTDRKHVKYIILKLLKVNKLKDAYIRLAATRGQGRVGLNTADVKDQALVIAAGKIRPYPDRMYKIGMTLSISAVRRNERSPASQVKSLNYLDSILARIEAQRGGADDALLLNTRGGVAETPVGNIFMVKDAELVTPSVDSGALPGITRDIILAYAGEAGLRPVERRIKPKELMSVKEVFVTNTLMEVMPVAEIDGRKIGTGRPGPITRSLHQLYRSGIRDYC